MDEVTSLELLVSRSADRFTHLDPKSPESYLRLPHLNGVAAEHLVGVGSDYHKDA